MSNVTSAPLIDGQVATKPTIKARGDRTGIRAGGIMLVIIGALLWMAGARYTLAGWHIGINWFLSWLGMPDRFPPIVGRWILLAIPLGIAYSLVELRRPWLMRGRDYNALALYWVVWLLIVVSDGGSTFLGVKAPGPDAWLVAQQVAASDPLAAIWSMILTFVPEWFILGGIYLLRR